FELKDRYEKIRHKTETIMDITEAFSNLVHARRGTRLEWAIIILIVIEIVLSLYDLFFR
ncbi:MAG: putative YagE family, partial [Sporomusa sp.]|nr:putative YagE family [Sporomusa sp.]